MRILHLTVAVALASAQSPVKVVKQPAPEKALIFEVTIPAARAAVKAPRAFSAKREFA